MKTSLQHDTYIKLHTKLIGIELKHGKREGRQQKKQSHMKHARNELRSSMLNLEQKLH